MFLNGKNAVLSMWALCDKFYALFAVDFVGINKAYYFRQSGQDYGNCQQIEFTICLDNRVLSVGKNGFISVLTLSKH